MTRLPAVILAVALVASTTAVAPAAAEGFVSVSTTVTPTDPVPEEEFTITANVSNADDTDTGYDIEELEVRRGRDADSDLVAERGVTARVNPGQSTTLDIGVALNETGTHTVYLHLTLDTAGGGDRTVVQPVTVQVHQPHPQMEVSTAQAPAGEEQTLTVAVANGLDSSLRNVELEVAGEGISARNPRRVSATVESGDDKPYEFQVTPDAERVQDVVVTVEYTIDGDRRNVTRTLAADFSVPAGTSQHPQLTVSTDAQPPGEEQTLTVAVANGLQESIRNVEVAVDSDTVAVRNPRRAAATVDSGDETPFEFRVTPESNTVHDVTVSVQYTLGDQRRNFTRTLATDFSVTTGGSEHPQVGIRAESAAPGEPRTTTVTLSNGLDSAVRNVELLVGGDRVTFNDNRRVTAAVAAGESQAFEFSATPETATTLPVEVTVRYTLDGERRGVTRRLDTDFSIDDEPSERPQLELSVAEAIPGATRPVNVTVANGLDNSVRQLSVRVASPTAQFDTSERVRAQLGAGRTVSFHFPASVEEAGTYPVNVTMTYTDDGVRQRVTRTFQAAFAAPPNPGEITLTGVEAVARGGTLEISATASNIGSDSVTGVVVSAAGTGSVEPADYFVGSIDGSDFSSFTLTTSVSGNVSSVPVEVRYVVDGVERTYTTELSVQQVVVNEESSGSGPPVVPVLAVLGVVIVAVVIYRRRG
ncbi:MAG: hypothetical protein ABEH77_11105 [Halobacteriaceae archaeon]